MTESGNPNFEVDGAHVIEHRDICELCENTASVGYCSECECYICQLCFDNHIKIKKNHHHVLQIAPERKEDDHTVHFKTCTEHTQQEVQLYCTDHKSVGCTECMAFNHKSCKYENLTEASKEFQDSGKLAGFLHDIQDLENVHQNCVESIASQSELLDNLDKTTTHSVQQFVKYVVSYVTDEEKLIFNIADSKKSINKDKIEKLSDDLKRIGSDISSISANVKENDMIHRLFILAVEAKPKLSQIRDTLTAIDCEDVIDRYTFYPCRLLQRQLSEKRPLGKLSDNAQSEQDDVDDYECKYKAGCAEIQQLQQQLSSQEKIMHAQKQDNQRLQQKLSTQEKLNKRLQQQLSSQKMDITKSQQQLSTQKQDNIMLKQQLSTQEQDNAKLQQQLSTKEQKKAKLQQQLSTQKQDNTMLQQKLSSQEQDNIRLQQQLTTQEQDNKKLQQQLSSLEQDNKKLQQQLSTQEQEKKKIQQQLSTQEQDNAKLQKQLSAKEQNNTKLQQQLSTQEEDNTKRQQQLSTQEQDNAKLQQQLSAKEQDNAKLQQQLSTQEEDNTKLQQQLSTQEQDNTKLQQQLSTQEQDNAKLQQQLSAKEQNNAKLQQQLCTLEQKNEKLQQQQSTQEQSNTLLQQQQSTQEKDIEQLQQQLSTHEQNNTKLQQQLSTHGQDNAKLQQQLSTHGQDNAKIQQQLSTHEQNNKELQQQLSTQEQDNANLQQQLSSQEQDNQRKTLQILKLERVIDELIKKTNAFILACGHVCDVGQKNKNRTIKCPTCDIIFGDQPDGTLRIDKTTDTGALIFKFDKGTQSKLNLNPGKPYEGREVTGYVYFDENLQQMLKLAYDRKILFTINKMGKIVLNGIDIFTWSDYVDRVEKQLRAKGITRADVSK